MKHKDKLRLTLEQLEDRWVPTTVKVFGTTLLITNPTPQNGVSTVTVTETGTGLTVQSGSLTVDVGNVSSIIYEGGLGQNSFTFNANGNSYAGNLFVITNRGFNDSVNIGSENGGGAPGTIRGNVTVLTGYGMPSVAINSGPAGTADPFTVRGNVQVDNLKGVGTLATGNDTTASTTSVFGNFAAVGQFSTVALGNGADTFSSNVSVNNLLSIGSASMTVGNTANAVTINGSLALYGNGANDSITLQGTAVAPLNIVGPAQISLGNGTSIFTSDSQVSFGSGFNLNGGNGGDTVAVTNSIGTTGTTFFGNAAINLGDGDNSFNLGNPFSALNNFSITAGNGDNGVGGVTIAGDIGGSLGVFLGSGDNGTFTVTGPVSNTVYWRSTNGTDTLQLGDNTNTDPNNYNLSAFFGNYINTFNLDINNANFLTGILSGGAAGTNTFNQNSGQIGVPFQKINF